MGHKIAPREARQGASPLTGACRSFPFRVPLGSSSWVTAVRRARLGISSSEHVGDRVVLIPPTVRVTPT